MILYPRDNNQSEYEKRQEKRAIQELDDAWLRKSSTTTSSTTSIAGIFIKDPTRTVILEKLPSSKSIPPASGPSVPPLSPPVCVLLWRWLVKFFRRFHKWNRYTGFFS
jgi:hypothetical protein